MTEPVACEYTKHQLYGTGVAEWWVITDARCCIPFMGRNMCTGCMRKRVSMARARCTECSQIAASPAIENILKIERLTT